MKIDEQRLANMMDRLEIEQVLVRYSTLIDTKQFARLATDVFTDDAIVDYTKAPGGIAGSVAEVTAWLSSVLEPFTVIQHMLGNFDITVNDDHARSVCYFHNPMGLPAERDAVSMFWCGGRYIDELVRTPHGWRINHRVDDVLYMQGLPAM
jgi:3-phenylpropionate/cinnamic acid dioxygenase small subunit